jgi:hypothetical protein
VKKIIVTTIFILLSILSTCFAEAGVVVYADYNKQLLVMQTDNYGNLTCAETIGALQFPEVGEIFYGTMNSYGMYDWYNQTNDYYITAMIDEVMVDEREAFRWISSH